MKTSKSECLVGIAILMLTGAVFGQTQVPNTFQSGQPARAAEVNDNFSAVESAINQNAEDIVVIQNDVSTLQGEQAVQNDRIDALQAVPPFSIARWRVVDNDNPVFTVRDDYEIEEILQDPNGFLAAAWYDHQHIAVTGEWLPVVINLNTTTIGWMGTSDRIHRILAYAPGSNCTGAPVAMFARIESGMTVAAGEAGQWQRGARYGYDPRNQTLYRAAVSGTEVLVGSTMTYDFLQYGYPSRLTTVTCSSNQLVTDRPDIWSASEEIAYVNTFGFGPAITEVVVPADGDDLWAVFK